MQKKFDLRSRTYAENLILKGQVLLNGKVMRKPSFDVDVDAENDVRIENDLNFASQGAYKLLEALTVFGISVNGSTCVDIGCSNGGFTDCLLRSGAKSVLAVDVAECALPESIASDPRVTFLRANARNLALNEKYDFVCGDVSFISLTLVLPSAFGLTKEGGECVFLIKPQFELDKSSLGKRGVVLSERDRAKAVEKVRSFAVQTGFAVKGVTPAPVYYEEKNVEYLIYLEKPLR